MASHKLKNGEGLSSNIKGIELDLQESESKYRTLVNHSLQGLMVAQGVPPRLVFVNPAMADIMGYTVEEMLSLSPEEARALADNGSNIRGAGSFADFSIRPLR